MKIMKNIIFYFLIIFLFLSCKKEQTQVKTIRGKQIEVNQNFKSDSTFIQFISPYKNELQNKVNKVLCYNLKTLTRKESDLESSLGNIYADICFQKSDSIFKKKTGKSIDFALFNYGGIRTVIPKGNITVKNVFQLMPFENMLVIAELSGKQAQTLFNYLEKRQEAHPISHLKLQIKGEKLNKILIQNKPFDISKNYYVLTHDYLQHGGDRMDFFKNPISLFNVEVKVRDAIIDYLSKIDTLNVKIDGRFIKVN